MTVCRRRQLLARSALCGVLGAMAIGAAPALAQVTGVGTITGTTSNGGAVGVTSGGGVTGITLGASRSIVNWNSLNVTPTEALNFYFANRGDIVLNRVAGAASIDGVLSGCMATCGTTGGNIWILSAGGVVIGANARISTGGFLASTGGLTDADILDGDLNFAFTGAPAGGTVSVASGAQIATSGGTLALIAPIVTTAAGATLTGTNGGDVVYGSAENYNVTFAPTGTDDLDLISFQVPSNADGSGGTPGLTLNGTTNANQVFAAMVSKTGVAASILLGGAITATTAVGEDGDIVLSGGAGFTNGVADTALGGTVGINITGPNALTSTGGDISISSSGTVDWNGGAGDIAATSITAEDQVIVAADGSITLGSVSGANGISVIASTLGANATVTSATAASGDIFVRAVDGAATLVTGNAGADIRVSGATATLGTGTAARDIIVTAAGGDATVTTSATAGDDIEITATGSVFAGNATLTATGVGAADDANVLVRSTGGSVSVGHARALGTGVVRGDVFLQANNDITVLEVQASRDARVWSVIGSANLEGDLIAAETLRLSAFNILDLDVNLTATDIIVSARDGIGQSAGSITATDLTVYSALGAATLTGPNRVTNLDGYTNGAFTFANEDALVVGALDIGGSLNLTAGGALTQNDSLGGITAASLTVTASGGLYLTGDNSVGSIDGLHNSGSGQVRYSSAGGILLAGAVTNDGLVSLVAKNGSITQSAAITAGTLWATATDGIVLGNAGNDVASLGPLINTGSGGITYRDASGFDLAGNVTATLQNISLTSNGGITQSSGVITGDILTASAASGVTLGSANNLVALDVISAGTGGFTYRDVDNIALMGDITSAQTVSLTSDAGGILQAGGSVVATALSASAATGIRIDGAANDVDTLGAITNTGDGLISISDLDGLDLAGVVAANGPAGTVAIRAGSLTQSGGSITANLLQLDMLSGGATLTRGNNVGELIARADGLAYRDIDSFTIQAIQALGGNITLTSDTGAITQTGDISGRRLSAQAATGILLDRNNNVSFLGSMSNSTSGGISFRGSSHLNIDGPITAIGQTVTLSATAGAITQWSGAITANLLNAEGVLGVDLTRDNLVTSLGVINAGVGDFSYRDVDDIALTGNVTAGTTAGTTIFITSNTGAITQTGGIITGDTLGAQAATGITLDQVNQLANLGSLTNTTSGGITYRDANALVLTGDISAAGQIVTLTSGGAISQSGGIITAGTLTGNTYGLTLTQANMIDTLGGFSSYASELIVNNAKALNVTGLVGGEVIEITTTAGALTASALIQGSDVVRLTGAAGVTTTGIVYGNNAMTVTAITGDAFVQRGTTNGFITVHAPNGDATLRRAALGAAVNGISVTAGGVATLGADNYAGIASTNIVDRIGGAGAISVVSSGGDARVFLSSLNTNLTLVDAGPGGTAAIGVAEGFTVGTVDGRNVALTAPSGTINATSVNIGGGDYSFIGENFSTGVFTPTGTIEDLSITDTLDGLLTSRSFSVTGNIRIEATNGGSVTINGALMAGAGAGAGVGDVTLIGAGVAANSITANRDVTINAGTGTVLLSSGASVGSDYNLTGGSFNVAALSPEGAQTGTWTLTDTVGGLDLTITAAYEGSIVFNIGDALTGSGAIFSANGGVTVDAGSIDFNNIYGAGGAVDLTTGGDLDVNWVQAGGNVRIDSGGLASVTTITTPGSIDLAAAGNVAVGSAGAGADISLVSNGGALTVARVEMSGSGVGHDLTLSSLGDLRLGAASATGIIASNIYSRAGTGATSITSGAGSVTANLYSAAALGDIEAGVGVDVTVQTGDILLATATAQTGSLSLTAQDGDLVVTSFLTSALDLGLTANAVSAQLLSASGDLTVTANTGALFVSDAQAGDDITLTALDGAATLERAVLTGLGADTEGTGRNLSLTGAGLTTFGATSEAGITSDNTLVRNPLAASGTVTVASTAGDTNVFLYSANTPLTTLSGDTVTATVATGDLSIGGLTAVNAILNTPGNLTVSTTPGISGDYFVTASNFGGLALMPSSDVDDFTIVDTAGGLVLGGGFSITGNLAIDSAGMLSIGADLRADGVINVESHGGLNILAAGSLTSAATGDAIVVASDGGFANYAGASALSTVNGRWLVYTQAQGAPTTPGTNILGGLAGKSYYGSTYDFASGAFSVAPSAGNRFVYAYQPILTVTPNSQTVTYNGQIPTLTALITGLINGDLAADAWSGQASISGATSRNVGTYGLAASLGSLLSDMNYGFAFGTGTLVIDPKTLTGVVLIDDKIYDGDTSATGSIGLTGVVAGDDVAAVGAYAFADRNAGAGKAVVVSGVGLSGADAGNYTLDPLASAVADILRKTIFGTLTASNKTYDGTTSATGSIGLTGVIVGDDIAAGGTYSFTDKNAGVGKTVTATGVTLSGADAGNYDLSAVSTAIADILRKSLVGTLTAGDKTYDGTTAASGAIGLTGVVAGDTVSADGTYAFADRNAGSGKTVTASGVALSGIDAANYDLTTVSTAIADILRKSLTGALTASSKTYDGNNTATGSVGLTGVVAGDDVSVSGGTFTFADKTAGAGKTVTASGVGLTGGDAANYDLTAVSTAIADIVRKSLTGIVIANDKTYDGTTTATGSVSLAGVIAGDTVSTTGGSYSFADKTAGAGKTVTASGVALAGADAANYQLDPLATAVADILRKSLTGVLAANDKTYDGTTTATGSVSLTGVIAGDTVTAGGSYAFADKTAGVGKTVTASGVALSGADAGNYDLGPLATAVADILRKSISGTLVANDKTYDGTTTASGSVSLVGVIAGDTVSTTGGSYSFADKAAGAGKTVSASGVTLAGADAANYQLDPLATAVADILRKSITGTLVANDKTYDGATSATGSVSLTGVVAGDTVLASGGTYSFADKTAGANKTVTAAGVTLSGADAANYDLGPLATAVADILRKSLTGVLVADGKTYDGTTAATGAISLTGVIAGDTVTAGGGYSFADKTAGTGKTVTATGVTLAGADAGNYDLGPLATAVADILRKSISGTLVANDKTYDGATTATGSVSLTGVVAGDAVTASGGTYSFADKAAGVNKTVTASGVTLAGADAANYDLGPLATAVADILRKSIGGTLVANDKTYDGTTTASGSVTLSGVIAGDAVTAGGGTYSFADRNAGVGKTVTAAGVTLAGVDAGNYTLDPLATAVADILRKAITGTLTADNKTYDGTTAATGSLSLTGLIAGDTVTANGGTYSFADANADAGKTVTVSGVALGGGDAGNYVLAPLNPTVADILRRAIAVAADDQSRTTGHPDPALTWRIVDGGLVQGDAFTGGLVRQPGENAGTYVIGQGSLALSQNYDLTFTPGAFVITVARSVSPEADSSSALRHLRHPKGFSLDENPSAGLTILDGLKDCEDEDGCEESAAAGWVAMAEGF